MPIKVHAWILSINKCYKMKCSKSFEWLIEDSTIMLVRRKYNLSLERQVAINVFFCHSRNLVVKLFYKDRTRNWLHCVCVCVGGGGVTNACSSLSTWMSESGIYAGSSFRTRFVWVWYLHLRSSLLIVIMVIWLFQ